MNTAHVIKKAEHRADKLQRELTERSLRFHRYRENNMPEDVRMDAANDMLAAQRKLEHHLVQHGCAIAFSWASGQI